MEIPTQLNSVTKEVRNQNNRFIPYIKTVRNKKFIFLFSIFGIDTLDMDRSYLVNYLYFLLSFLLSFLMTKELDLVEWELFCLFFPLIFDHHNILQKILSNIPGLCSGAGEPAKIFFFRNIWDFPFYFNRKEVLSFRNPHNIHYLNIHRKGELLRIFDQLRYLETIFFDYLFIRIRSGFFFYFGIFSTLDSRTNRWITTKKQRLAS